jgi:rhamnose utilization protein RhaD (predicted bifunctional aldolase and dehydrogenase)
MCKLIGPWTDWIQGPGGNFSIKNDSSVLVKQSGFCIANTTEKNGWVLCCLKSLVEAIHLEKESIDKNKFAKISNLATLNNYGQNNKVPGIVG